METLYAYTNNKNDLVFFIQHSSGKRSYRCYSLTDPDLYKITDIESLPSEVTYILKATAEHFTPNLVKERFPEYFI